MVHDDCEKQCRKNCSCPGYSEVDIRQGGTGCLLWFDDLLDIRDFRDNGLGFYVRTPTSLDANRSSKKKKGVSTVSIIVIVALVVTTVLVVLFLIFALRKRKLRRRLRRRGKLAFNPHIDF